MSDEVASSQPEGNGEIKDDDVKEVMADASRRMAAALEEEERKEREERRKNREPPIIFKDAVDVCIFLQS